MIRGKYLSQLIDISQIEKQAANLVKTPCGTGKTYMVFNCLLELASNKNRVLYLIDTTAGKEQLLSQYETQIYDEKWYRELSGEMVNFEPDKITVMTYSQFGFVTQKYPSFTDWLELIICDEAHNLVQYASWDKSALSDCLNTENSKKAQCLVALSRIKQLCQDVKSSAYVVMLTATPRRVNSYFDGLINEIKIEGELREYETLNTIEYRSIYEVISELPRGKQSICFVSKIVQMKQVEQYAKAQGFQTMCIWSKYNDDFPSTDEQLEVRKIIEREQRIPQGIEILFLNKSLETSINIYSEVYAVVVHNSDRDVIEQVRGRVRSDLPFLYVHNCNHNSFHIPPEFLDTPLFTEQKKELAMVLNLRDDARRQLKWPTIKGRLKEYGYDVRPKRIGTRTADIITRAT